MKQTYTEVAVGVIFGADRKVLLAQRPCGKSFEGYWEFPGGKIEIGENPREALKRELYEEIGIVVRDLRKWITRVFSYDGEIVRLHFYRVYSWDRAPYARENQSLSWESPTEIGVYPLLPANSLITRFLKLPEVYAISSIATYGLERFMKKLFLALERGVRLVQFREKQFSQIEKIRIGREVVKVCARFDAQVLVNDDLEIANEVGAAGVHMSSSKLMQSEARPDVKFCGASCHTRKELEKAARIDLDFVVLGPVKFTKSHPKTVPIGWENFECFIEQLPIPVYALGGLGYSSMDDATARGAHGIAMLSNAW